MAQNIRLTDKVSNVNEEDELRKRGYIVGVTLGEGSYAKVKSAFSETHNRKVALKIINRKKAPKDFQQRFLPRELDILRRIRHPNVIQLVDIMHFNHKVNTCGLYNIHCTWSYKLRLPWTLFLSTQTQLRMWWNWSSGNVPICSVGHRLFPSAVD